MNQTSRIFRIFVSSTFSDMVAERNALQKTVFPELRKLCEQHGSRFQAIDLRWGVSEEAALDQQAMKICLSEVERCQRVSPRPNFIILLGNRYGWRPLRYEIPADEFERILNTTSMEDQELLLWKDGQAEDSKGWYRRDDNALPPTYLLQPRTGKFIDPERWGPIESSLHAILETAATKAGLAETDRIRYVTSATEQEIIHGAIQVVDARKHIFCFTRETEAIPPENEYAKNFIDLAAGKPDEKAAALLVDLKTRLKGVLGGNYHEYPARWEGSGPTREHIDQFAKDVHDSLSKVIQTEIEHPREAPATIQASIHIQPDPALDAEGLSHHQFAEERLRFFVGRTEMLAKIDDYLKNSDRRILGIVGGGGTGKSALMAKAVEKAQAAYPNAAIVYRFIGTTPGSSDGRSLLDSLCHEITHRYGTDEPDIPVDYRDLVPELGKRMALAAADRPLILFLDSLDQLSPSQGARSLIWLPNELPEHVSVVVSTREEDTWKNLQSKSPREEVLSGLSRMDGEELLSQWLADIHRTLQPSQREEVMAKFEVSQGNPLYLKLAFEEARLWTSYHPQEQLATGVSEIIKQNMIDRLKNEGSHGEALVSHALGYLAASRYGLAEDEMVDLLSRDPQVYTWFYRKSYHLPTDLVQAAVQYRKSGSAGSDKEQAAIAWLNEIRDQPEQAEEFLAAVLPKADGPRLPVVLWSRLSFDLAPYLSERAVDGSPLLNFYHRELGDVSKEVFLSDGNEKMYHTRLADYFRFEADPDSDKTWNGHSIHGLSELPYHLTLAERFDDAYQVLTDFKFLEHKAAEVGVLARTDEQGKPSNMYTGVLQLQEDYELALTAMGGGEGSMGNRAPLILTALETSKGLMVYCPVCNQASPIEQKMLGKEIPCPQEKCKAPIKLNPFTVKREL